MQGPGARCLRLWLAFLIAATAILFEVPSPLAARSAPVTVEVGGPGGQFQPAASGPYTAWRQNTRRRPGHFNVVAKVGARRMRVNAPGTNAANGGISGHALVYQQWKGGRSDLKRFNLRTRERTSMSGKVNTRHWEYWPSQSGKSLLFGRRKGASERSIILYNRATKRTRVLDAVGSRRSFLGPGQVNGDFAVWWKCPKNLKCSVFRYKISTRTKKRIPNGGWNHSAASVSPSGAVYLARARTKACGVRGSLMRYRNNMLRRIASVPRGQQTGDTYVTTDKFGNANVWFDRFVCGRPTASDIFRARDPQMRTLSVTVRGRRGMVESSPQGIQCESFCRRNFVAGTSVTLTPIPAQDFEFLGWRGDCLGRGRCTVLMDAP